MRLLGGFVVAAVALAGARAARIATVQKHSDVETSAHPFAPAPGSAPFIAVGFREAFADLLYVRLIGYFNGQASTGDGVADLAEAVADLDPHFKRVYELGANAMTLAKLDVTQNVVLRAVALLERGMKVFPQEWRLPYLAGQIYTQDLKSADPAQEREWSQRGVLLVESAIRKPGAPVSAAAWAAVMRTKLGEHERAVANLREMLLVTNDAKARQRLFAALADLEEKDASVVASEVYAERYKFERQWRAERPSVPPTLYILIGPRIRPGFSLAELAAGGPELSVQEQDEPE
jgi:hypothetical protein